MLIHTNIIIIIIATDTLTMAATAVTVTPHRVSGINCLTHFASHALSI